MPRAKRTEPVTNVGVLLPVEVWKQFRIQCIKDGRQPGHVLEALLREHLKGQGAVADAAAGAGGDCRPERTTRRRQPGKPLGGAGKHNTTESGAPTPER